MSANRPQNIEDMYPLSPMQQGMLFHTLYAPQSGVYVEQVSCVLRGELHIPAFERAWQQVVERHAALRSAFVWNDLDAPLQVVRRKAKLSWQHHDWRAVAPDEQRARRADLLRSDRARGFNLAKAPLMRLILIRLDDTTFQFTWSHHHLLMDGWSLPLVLKEVFTIYEAEQAGRSAQLAPARPYRDYIEWLQRQSLAESERFWRDTLGDLSAPTPLGVDRALSGRADEPERYATAELRLDRATTAALQTLARQHGLTLSTLVQGAWAILLSRYSNQQDVVFGVTVSGRSAPLPGIETIVGLFINTLPLRTPVPPQEPLLDWLKQLQTRQFAVQQHEHSPLLQVHGWSGVPRGQPLFDSIVVFENYPVDDTLGDQLGSVAVEAVEADEQTNYALTVVATGGAELTLAITYDCRRFESTAIERLVGHCRTLFAGMAENPQRTIGALPYLADAERQQIAYDWNVTAAPYSRDVCMHELFEQQAARTPDALAVIAPRLDGQRRVGERRLSYAELNREANQIAHQLRALGVGRGDLVAIYLDRSIEMIPVLLAILKAGAAYIPLDLSFPQARMQWILDALGVRHVLTGQALLPTIQAIQLDVPALAHAICLDADQPIQADTALRIWSRAELAAQPTHNLDVPLSADDLAYIIFTSGSTGQPKGVMIQHRPVINLIEWVNQTFAVGGDDQVLFITSLSFDLSVYDIFGLLAAGGSIRVALADEVRDPQRLVQIMRDEPITYWDSAPAALQQLVPFFNDRTRSAATPALRLVFLSGDWIPVTLPDAVRATFTRAEIVALGGGTEATIWSNFYRVRAVDPRWASIPYGKPIQNAAYYVLDAQMQPCPVGVAGDLYIGDECLALGYADEPRLSAVKFVPDPFSSTPGARLYRTGDLARFWADGNIEFLGRVDHQVKIRGFRVELGEIEAALVQHPQVRAAAVLAQPDGEREKRLVAYVVGTEPRTKNQEPGEREPRTKNQEPGGGGREPGDENNGTHEQGNKGSADHTDGSQFLVLGSSELRQFLQRTLPVYMLPSVFVFLDELPVTANGKLDRAALPAPDELRPELSSAYSQPTTRLEQTIAEVWQTALRVERVGIYDNFFDLGGHSLLLVRVHGMLHEALPAVLERPVELAMLDLFQYPTIQSLAAYLSRTDAPDEQPTERGESIARQVDAGSARRLIPAIEDIAVIGMSGRFPKSPDIESFWQHLRDGVDLVTFFSEDELIAAGVDRLMLRDPRYVPASAPLDDADLFDASFFGITPREAEIMDPQHRVFLECAWSALEHAGYDSDRYDGQIGVYTGESMTTYLLFNLHSREDVIGSVGEFQIAFGNDKDYLSTRVSYKLNLRGPSMTVQTACSTSLLAIHLACQSLWTGESDMALAGGVSVHVPLVGGYVYQEGGIASPDGHCRAFDKDAAGIVGGNGVGVVVLKRLSEAQRDGDTIYAVIKGSAANNDGSHKVGYTAPSVNGQAEVIARALAVANVDPATISYVEAHGTGTTLGDPIEVTALTRAWDAYTDQRQYCAIGSVKSNMGHLDAAAGVASAIKTIMALQHKQIPPSLHFETPNPKIDFANSPFYVNTNLSEWQANGAPRRAGVSAFGIGGTNVHLIMEEAPPEPAATDPGTHQPQVLVLAAATASALERMTDDLAAFLRAHPDVPLADIAYTLQVGRRALSQRRMVVAADHADAIAALESRDPQRLANYDQSQRDRPVAFMFSGQGAQYVNMGRELYETLPRFREIVDQCCALLEPELGRDLRALLYPDTADGQASAADQLSETWLTQPALFVIEYALALIWQEWGVRPHALIGHSIGEYVAATLAGVFALPDALRLVAARGRLMQSCPAGAMLSVALSEADVQPMLSAEIALAAINGPSQCVLAGSSAAIELLERQMAAIGIEARRLHTSHAFHSPLIEAAVAPFAAEVARVALHQPTLPFISNVSGTWISAEQATDPGYWADHLRQPVRFAAGLSELLGSAHPQPLLLEVGPGRTLTTFARQIAPGAAQAQISLRHPQDQQSDLPLLLASLGRLWLLGAHVDWSALHSGSRRRRVALPTYPFERQRYWVEPHAAGTRSILDAFRKQPEIADWLYLPVWKQALVPPTFSPQTLAEQPGCWLIFCDEHGLGARLHERLTLAGQQVIAVEAGERFVSHGDDRYTLNPLARADYLALLADLRTRELTPQQVVHLWSVDPQPATPTSARFVAAQERGFESLLLLAQALGKHYLSEPIQIVAVSNNMHAILGEDLHHPEQITLLGPCKVIPQEYPNLTCRSVDLGLSGSGAVPPTLADQLLAECVSHSDDLQVAYRGRQRWIQTFDRIAAEASTPQAGRLRERGVYLITGGLGGIGLTLAEHLARTVQARLVLIGRTPLPERAEWSSWLAQRSEHDATSRKIRTIQSLEQLGAEVLVISADAGDAAQMQAALRQTLGRFGALHGVLHAAGVVGEHALRTIQELTPQESASQFHAKAHGLLALDRALADTLGDAAALDFCLLFSSLSSVLGGLGFSAYAAANLFMDAFAQQRSQHADTTSTGYSATPWISVNWDAWESPDGAAHGGTMAEMVIVGDEGMSVLERILALGATPQVVVSTGDLHARIETWVQMRASRQAAQSQGGELSVHARPNLLNPFVAPESTAEQQIATIWRELMGIEPIGLYDNFFELGGHSLLATQVVSRLRDAFQVDLSLRYLFETPTVHGLAAVIGQLQAEQRAEAGAAAQPVEQPQALIPIVPDHEADLLAQLDHLSDDEVAALLATMSQSDEDAA